MAENDLPTMMRVSEVALALRVSESVIRRWCRDGTLPAVKVGKAWLVSRAEVLRVLREGTEPQEIELAGGRTWRPSIGKTDDPGQESGQERSASPGGGSRPPRIVGG